ncbi:MAG: glycosyltransferase family 4 protein [Chlorobi bacterium]|nr:glycosyltransferase family 4 protein [Chlorobiota bacterium]MCI0715179.1 glycosyltransferase family 4 protein [Chlorobiota bacterium]
MHKNKEKIKAVICCGSVSWGGLEMAGVESAVKLSKQGHEVLLVCRVNSKLESEAKLNSLKTLPVFSKDIMLVSSIIKLKKIIKEFKPDVIHTHLSHDLWVIVPALSLTGSNAKLFLTKHMASGVKKKDLFHKFLYKRVNKIFAVSNYIKESVLNTCPAAEENVILLPDGIDLQKFNPALYNKSQIKKQNRLPEDRMIIGIIGRMTPGKGHEEFLNAAKIINENYSDKVFFLVVGSASFGEDDYETKIRNLAEELNLANILFTGYRKDTPEMLSVMDILAFPSHNESFGITLLEAMAMGVPPAASGNAGVLDIVINNETGLLVEPKNSVELAGAIIKLINDEELRKKFAKAARNRAEQEFDFNIIINRLIENYTQ